jgi:5-methyltetrahydropteroyltriglutamate--homocysteine methyltransferase
VSSSSRPHPVAHVAAPSYRAEVVGSLLRPEALRSALGRHADGSIGDDELSAVQDRAVADAVALQSEAGLEVCTDGEMRRRHFADPLLAGLHCFGSAPGAGEPWRDAAGEVEISGAARAVTRRLEFRGTGEVAAYRAAVAAAALPVKVTVPGPTALLTRWVPEVSADAYPDIADLFRDTAEILAGIVAELAAAGCRYVQIDAPELTAVVDPATRDGLERKGLSPDGLIDIACELINAITDRADPDVKFAVHLCRGNLQGLWRKRGGYEAMAETFFTRLRGVDTFMLEFDDERSGSFDCLASLPDDKVAVLGVITTKRGELEAREEIVGRIRSAAEHVPIERLALSTQCGFASTAAGNPITAQQQRAKLELVADVARAVWPAD